MKLEKEVYVGNVTSNLKFTNNKRSCCFNCIVYEGITEDELKILKECHRETKAKLTLEIEQPILDEKERKYLSGVIRPFRNKIKFIRKCCIFEREYINIAYNSEFIYDNNFNLPTFEEGIMYKNMTLNKEYTLEDLEL